MTCSLKQNGGAGAAEYVQNLVGSAGNQHAVSHTGNTIKVGGKRFRKKSHKRNLRSRIKKRNLLSRIMNIMSSSKRRKTQKCIKKHKKTYRK